MKQMIGLCFCLLLLKAVSAQDRSQEMSKVLEAKPFIGKHVTTGGVRLELRGVYVVDGLLWFALRVENASVIDFRASPMRFMIRDRHTMRRRARQELALPAIARREPVMIHSDSSALLCYGLPPRLPHPKQELLLEYGEKNGDRRFMIRLAAKDVLRAKKLD